jgi:23S rRNA pseudouridine2605 synthase
MKERVQKIIAARGLCSRRAAEELIAAGKVKVNGHPVKLGAVCDGSRDLITVEGKKLIPEKKEPLYVLLNKPRGYVTTMSDEKGRKTVAELVRDVGERVYPVGRLDMGTEGLLIMTNDGELANFLTHPSNGVEKEYHATVVGDYEKAIPQFEAGMTLDDGFKTSPAVVRVVRSFEDRTILSVTIKEGHNRQVRRMCEAAGLTVRRLVRVAEGKLKVEDIPMGKWRYAKPAELRYIESLMSKEEEIDK